MKTFLAKRWFLICLALGIGLGWRFPDWLRPATSRMYASAMVGVALFLVSWSLDSRSLWKTLIHPWPALWAVFISSGVLPPLGWLVGRLLPQADLRMGLFIVTSVPCTLAAATLWTRMAGGNDSVALLVTCLTTCTSWLVAPAWFAVMSVGGMGTAQTAAMMRDLMVILIVPVGLGQTCQASGALARLAQRHKTTLGTVSQLLIIVIIVKSSVDVSDRLDVMANAFAFLGATVLCVGMHLTALAAGFWSSKALKFDRPSQIAVAFSCSQKTLPVAVFLFDSYFKDSYPLAIVPIVVYHVGQLIVDTFIAEHFRFNSHELAAEEAATTEGL